MSEPDVLGLAEAAAEVGVHYDTLRKHWRDWANPDHVDYCAFPMPFRAACASRKARIAWRRSALAAWKLAREHALGVQHRTPAGRRDPALSAHLAARRDPQLHNQRAALARLMERA